MYDCGKLGSLPPPPPRSLYSPARACGERRWCRRRRRGSFEVDDDGDDDNRFDDSGAQVQEPPPPLFPSSSPQHLSISFRIIVPFWGRASNRASVWTSTVTASWRLVFGGISCATAPGGLNVLNSLRRLRRASDNSFTPAPHRAQVRGLMEVFEAVASSRTITRPRSVTRTTVEEPRLYLG